MNCPKRECNGELVKVRKYYVCDACCSDIITFDDAAKIAGECRNVLQNKPKGKSIELLDPEFIGFYPYEITQDTKWRKTYQLKGRDGQPVGALVVADYTKCDFIKSSEPKFMAHLKHEGYVITVTIQENDILFH